MYWTCKLFGDARDNDIVNGWLCVRGQQGKLDRSPSILPPMFAKSTAGGLRGRTQVQNPFGRGQISLRLYIIPYVELRGRSREIREVNYAANVAFLRKERKRGKQECAQTIPRHCGSGTAGFIISTGTDAPG